MEKLEQEEKIAIAIMAPVAVLVGALIIAFAPTPSDFDDMPDMPIEAQRNAYYQQLNN